MGEKQYVYLVEVGRRYDRGVYRVCSTLENARKIVSQFDLEYYLPTVTRWEIDFEPDGESLPYLTINLT
jgi:hypothetical protein